MLQTPHKDKLVAATNNPKCGAADVAIIQQCLVRYETWIANMGKVQLTGRERVLELTKLLNTYKDDL
jgi:hypothetical protein